MRLLWFRRIVVNSFVTSQHNDTKFQKIVSKFENCMKNGFRVTVNDEIRRVFEQLCQYCCAKKRCPITSDLTIFHLLQEANVKDKIRVNCLCPSFSPTTMVEKGLAARPEMRPFVEKIGIVP